MQFKRLRVQGFKTFVEPIDAPIEPGLTGVVGPNGCGKSNLVEAMRWVMGESSHKSLRASGMDDVIFAGSGGRPARNHAEVSLVLDNSAKTAPAPFNNLVEIEVSRRISRGLGSTYRVNGREVRARDVQLLFADASSGPRSPALVGQGRVSEIINARPEQRRRVLEDAAGVAGLHQRRREAEQRLGAAEQNLSRVEDVLGRLSERAEALRKQARGAQRYRALTDEIRVAEGLSLLAQYEAGSSGAVAAETAETTALATLAEATRRQGEAARDEAVAAHALEPARLAAAEAGAALRRLTQQASEIEGEEKRTRARIAELAARIQQIGRDLEREQALAADAAASLAAVETALSDLGPGASDDDGVGAAAAKRLAEAEAAVAALERELSAATEAAAALAAERRSIERRLEDARRRLSGLEREQRDLAAEAAKLGEAAGAAGDLKTLAQRAEEAHGAQAAAERASEAAETAHAAARAREAAARGPAGQANAAADRLATEARTLSKLFSVDAGRRFPPVVDLIVVDPGFEIALGAALGDDLDAAVDPRAPAHWAGSGVGGDPALPAGATALAEHVVAPPELARTLAQIGVVSRQDGARLREFLAPGQRLVSREGDLWRWDGLTQAADAPTPAARRLAEKNRLGAVERAAADARAEADRLRATVEEARRRTAEAGRDEQAARENARRSRQQAEAAREAHLAAERAFAKVAARISAVEEAAARVAAQRTECEAACLAAEGELGGMPEGEDGAALDPLRESVAEARQAAGARRVEVERHAQELRRRTARRAELAHDIASWVKRRDGAVERLHDLAERRSQLASESETLKDRPEELGEERVALRAAVTEAERRSRAASDVLSIAESACRETAQTARTALDALAKAREETARAGARLEAAREKQAAVAARVMEARGLTPRELAASLAGVASVGLEEVEERLARAIAARERLGAVNLRAEEDLAEAETGHKTLLDERADLTEAIAKLRAAVRSLNQEGRSRLLAAFERVDAHFQTLFTKLFQGGEARLELVESDDPLEAGLEVIARPPGKKPQTLLLLSGGEQALTALALVFAVFLTNPAPVCVLDEVDAPLDDANVDRFCDLLAEMSRMTTTRFLTVTHNPITMARMDRLIGVTMAERGVSQLVSVDLQTAERLAEAV